MTTFEGDTGPYLQYTHVRLCSIIRKNKDLLPIPATIDLSPLATHVKAHELAMLAASYSEVLRTALKTRDPSGIVTFAMRLSHTIGGAMDTFGVKAEAERGSLQTARTRLALFIMARTVLGSAMRLLSLTPLERM
jgi:arginyl-tRNA synthetase